MLFQGRPLNFAVPYKPQFLFWIPPSARVFGLLTHGHVLYRDAQWHESVRGIARFRRCPFSSFDDKFDRFDPLPRLRIIPESDAKQGIAVLFHQAFGPPLARFEDQPCFHSTLRKE